MTGIAIEQGAARAMMDSIGEDGLVVDGRKLFFEYRFIFHPNHVLSLILHTCSWFCFVSYDLYLNIAFLYIDDVM